jgi:hypothetical protein
MPGRRLAVTLALAAVVLVAGCADHASGQTRKPVALGVDARLTAPDTIELSVMSCHGSPEVTQLSQDDQRVRIEVTSTVTDPGDACLDLLTVQLDAPLESRDVVDLTSGQTLRLAR